MAVPGRRRASGLMELPQLEQVVQTVQHLEAAVASRNPVTVVAPRLEQASEVVLVLLAHTPVRAQLVAAASELQRQEHVRNQEPSSLLRTQVACLLG